MSESNHKLGEKLEMSADRLFAHLDELALTLESIKAQFPGPPIVDSKEPGGLLTWIPSQQAPRNLKFMFLDWSMPQLQDQRFPVMCRQDIRVSYAA